MNYIIMCKSLTYAQRSAKALERAGIMASVGRTPGAISSEGCAYSIKISERRLNEAMGIIRNAGLNPGRIYKLDANGAAAEVFM